MKYQKPVVKKPKHEIVRGILESDSGCGMCKVFRKEKVKK